MLVVRRNNKGRGVYAGRRFYRGDVVDDSPVLLLRAADGKGTIGKYWWEWKGSFKYAIPLGKCSLFNYNHRPNTGALRLYKQNRIIFRALRVIQKGEEILIDYGLDFIDFKVLP